MTRFYTREMLVNELSKDERWLLDQIAADKVLLVRNQPCSRAVDEAMLTERDEPRAPANVLPALAQKLIFIGLLRPLSQYRWHHYIGWREIVGDLGEKWDVYVVSQ